MRISSTIAVLAAMFILGVSAAGETTSTDGNGATNAELQKQIDDYLTQPGLNSIELKEDVYRACNTGGERQKLQCVMHVLEVIARDRQLPLPPWTNQM